MEESMKNTATDDGIVIATGMATNENKENFNEVFHQADMNMYANKNALKEKRPSHNLR